MPPVFEFWPALAALSLLHLLAAMVPGPNTVVVTHLAAGHSLAAAFRAVAGIVTGTGTWVLLTLAGVTLLLQQTERSEEHTSELQSLMRISYAVFCLKKKKNKNYR